MLLCILMMMMIENTFIFILKNFSVTQTQELRLTGIDTACFGI